MRHALSLLAFSAVALVGRAANADEPQRPLAPASLAVERDMHSYYQGERLSAYVVCALAATSVASGSILVTRENDFARGLGWPLLTLGLLEGIGAAIYDVQVGHEIDHYQAAYDRDPAAYRKEELAHIRGTTKRFLFYRLTELGLTLGGAGVATYGFVANQDVWKGVGIGVAAIAIPFLVIDTVNDARAHRYRDSLTNMDARPSAALDVALRPDTGTSASATLAFESASHPVYVSFGGRF